MFAHDMVEQCLIANTHPTSEHALAMTSTSESSDSQSLIVQIASYNTNLQGSQGTPQDLVDWLSPTLSAAHFKQPPDIVAVGFQELLPFHLGCEFLKTHNIVPNK